MLLCLVIVVYRTYEESSITAGHAHQGGDEDPGLIHHQHQVIIMDLQRGIKKNQMLLLMI